MSMAGTYGKADERESIGGSRYDEPQMRMLDSER
jgi:hypothetical protein